VEKSGSWYSYNGERIGQGRENARTFLKEHPDVTAHIDKAVRLALGLSKPAEGEAALAAAAPVESAPARPVAASKR
jgi:recombination protein RecA